MLIDTPMSMILTWIWQHSKCWLKPHLKRVIATGLRLRKLCNWWPQLTSVDRSRTWWWMCWLLHLTLWTAINVSIAIWSLLNFAIWISLFLFHSYVFKQPSPRRAAYCIPHGPPPQLFVFKIATNLSTTGELFWWHFDPHIIKLLITLATNEEKLASAFQKKVYQILF